MRVVNTNSYPDPLAGGCTAAVVVTDVLAAGVVGVRNTSCPERPESGISSEEQADLH